MENTSIARVCKKNIALGERFLYAAINWPTVQDRPAQNIFGFVAEGASDPPAFRPFFRAPAKRDRAELPS
jgi:hypothetical protein